MELLARRAARSARTHVCKFDITRTHVCKLLTRHAEDLSNVQNDTHCPFSTFSLINVQYAKICSGVDVNSSVQHTSCDLRGFQLIAVKVLASLFSAFERRMLISATLHTNVCHYCVADREVPMPCQCEVISREPRQVSF